MNIEISEQTEAVKGFSHEAREQMLKDFLSNILTPNNTLLGSIDTKIIRQILIENKKLKDIGAELCLTASTVSERFYKAISRINIRYANYNEQLQNNIYMKEEIHFLKAKLKNFENIENPTPTVESFFDMFKRINEFGFSGRLLNILRAYDVTNLADLVKLPKKQFYNMRGVGKRSITEVDDFFKLHGLCWQMQY